MGRAFDGGYAEYTCVPATQVQKLETELPWQTLGAIPEMLKLIVLSAFTPTEATGAFVGGTVASAFLFGMKRAIFSNEAGQGSSAISGAQAAAITRATASPPLTQCRRRSADATRLLYVIR